MAAYGKGRSGGTDASELVNEEKVTKYLNNMFAWLVCVRPHVDEVKSDDSNFFCFTVVSLSCSDADEPDRTSKSRKRSQQREEEKHRDRWRSSTIMQAVQKEHVFFSVFA